MKELIGIIGAMDEEVEALIEEMDIEEILKKGGLTFRKGKIKNCECVVVRAGVGKVNAAMCTSMLIALFDVTAVINTGVAGGISKNYKLNIGDIVISKDAIEHDFDATGFGFELGQIPRMDNSVFTASKRLRKFAMDCKSVLPKEVKVYEGRVVTGDQFISSKGKIEMLAKTFNGDCAEMEGGSIAHVCYLNNIEFVIIRSISDSADGDAELTYQEFEKEAAKNSARLTEKILEKLAK